jgi:hypothetical protein
MTKSPIYDWYSPLPADILGRAYMSGGGEMAFNRTDAARGVNLRQERGYKVASIETWIPCCPGPMPLIDDWDETSSAISAQKFIETFDLENKYGHERGLPVFFCIDA